MCSSCANTSASPCCALCRDSLELALLLPGEQPWASFARFLLWLCHPPLFQSCEKAPETAQVYKMSSSSLHRKSSSAAAQSMGRQPIEFGCFPARGGCFEMELEGAWSNGISSHLPRLCSFRGMREWRGAAGMSPWPVSAMTSLICRG